MALEDGNEVEKAQCIESEFESNYLKAKNAYDYWKDKANELKATSTKQIDLKIDYDQIDLKIHNSYLEAHYEHIHKHALEACQTWLAKQPIALDLGNFAEVARKNTDHAHAMTKLCQLVGLGHKL